MQFSRLFLICCALIYCADPCFARVICQGDDGHIAVEPAVAGRCCVEAHLSPQAPAAPAAVSVGAEDHETHCGACQDVPLTPSPGVPAPSHNINALAPADACESISAVLARVTVAAGALKPASPPGELRPVLLI